MLDGVLVSLGDMAMKYTKHTLNVQKIENIQNIFQFLVTLNKNWDGNKLMQKNKCKIYVLKVPCLHMSISEMDFYLLILEPQVDTTNYKI